MTVYSYHVTYAFQSESTLCSCLNVKELLARSRPETWNLSVCNGTRTHNHSVRKRTLNHLAKLAKWLSCVVSTYLYGAFDCIFLSCHVRILECIHTKWLNVRLRNKWLWDRVPLQSLISGMFCCLLLFYFILFFLWKWKKKSKKWNSE